MNTHIIKDILASRLMKIHKVELRLDSEEVKRQMSDKNASDHRNYMSLPGLSVQKFAS